MTPTTSVENYLFWAGILIVLAFIVTVIGRLWWLKIKDYDFEVGVLAQFGLPFLTTAVVIAGMVFVGMGNPEWEQLKTQDFVPPSEVRKDFAEQVKADKVATKPQTKTDLKEERRAKSKEAAEIVKKAEADKDKATNESITDFRERMMKSRGEASPTPAIDVKCDFSFTPSKENE